MELSEIKSRLEQLGYSTVSSSDEELIQFSIQKISEHIQNFCNVSEIPSGLKYQSIDAVCGEFLKIKKATGKLEGYDLEQGVAAIKLGDTNVSFSGQSSEDQFNALVSHLSSELERDLSCFRKICW